MGRRTSALERSAPTIMLVIIIAAGVAILPSALRPPPDQASASAALSPDAPPEEEPEAIISSFQQASSATPGATESTAPTETTVPPTTAPPPEKRASSGLCFGTPPRQTESLYAPDCQPAFQGDNGGATWKNVSADLVRVGGNHAAGMPTSHRGPIPFEPQENEDSALRTWRVIQQYFNQRYETYGRTLQLVAVDRRLDGNDDELDRASATEADEEHQVFASQNLRLVYCDELARRQLVCLNENPFRDTEYERLDPYLWSFQMRADQNDAMAAEYVCKRLAGNQAEWGGPRVQSSTRKFGVVYQGFNGRSASNLTDRLSDRCGVEALGFDVSIDQPQTHSTAMTRMQVEGVTSVVVAAEVGDTAVLMSLADGSGYQPEWINIGSYGIDFNSFAALLPPSQTQFLFGMSGWEMPRPFNQTECYVAYKSIDPNNEPNASFCEVFFFEFQQLVIGIQEAGPNLTPDTFKEGLFAYGSPDPEAGWAIRGGYSPSDRSYVDEFAEIWWDPQATKPTDGTPGAYRWVNDGRRYALGEIPEGQPDMFGDNGVTCACDL